MTSVASSFSPKVNRSTASARLAYPNPYLVTGYPRASKPLFQSPVSSKSLSPQLLEAGSKGLGALALTVGIGSLLLNGADAQSAIQSGAAADAAQLPTLKDFQPQFPDLEISATPSLTPESPSTVQAIPATAQPPSMGRRHDGLLSSPRFTYSSNQPAVASGAYRQQQLSELPAPPPATQVSPSDNLSAPQVLSSTPPAITATVSPRVAESPEFSSAAPRAPHIASQDRGAITPETTQDEPIALEAAPQSPAEVTAPGSPSVAASPENPSVAPQAPHMASQNRGRLAPNTALHQNSGATLTRSGNLMLSSPIAIPQNLLSESATLDVNRIISTLQSQTIARTQEKSRELSKQPAKPRAKSNR